MPAKEVIPVHTSQDSGMTRFTALLRCTLLHNGFKTFEVENGNSKLGRKHKHKIKFVLQPCLNDK